MNDFIAAEINQVNDLAFGLIAQGKQFLLMIINIASEDISTLD